MTLKLPGRAVGDWLEWRGRLPVGSTAGAAIELALKLALEASVDIDIDDIGLMVNPQGPGRPGRRARGWGKPGGRPSQPPPVMVGGHSARRLEPGESATPIGGDPIRPAPQDWPTYKALQEQIKGLRDRIEALEKTAE